MSEEKTNEEKTKKIQENDIIQQLQEIEIRSDEVQEIMGYIPNWIIRWGITVIFLIVLLSLVGSWFFKYPDVIYSNIVITTENPPVNLMAKVSGKLTELFVKDNQHVTAGEPLAMLENACDYRHFVQLKKQLADAAPFFIHFENLPAIQFDPNFSLGELQGVYSQFLKSLADYQHFIALDLHSKKILAIKAQIIRYKELHRQIEAQARIIGDELKLSRVQYERSSALFKDGIISNSDYEAAKSGNLQKEYAYEGAKSSLSNSSIQISQLEQSVLDMELQYSSEQKQLQLALGQMVENLSGQMAQWEQTYLLKAPVSGVVTFNTYWSVNQNVRAGDRVVTVVPGKSGKIIGKLVLPIAGSGKVKIGQKVNIKFENYPFMEYGMVRGVIKSKSLVAADKFYSLEVDLPDGMVSSYNITLEFSQEMQGIAEIITEDIRLAERVLKPIKNILNKM